MVAEIPTPETDALVRELQRVNPKGDNWTIDLIAHAQKLERSLAFQRLKGTNLARSLGPEHAAHADAIEAMLQQLLIALVKRAGGKLAVPVEEIDDTGGHLLAFRIDERRIFHFEAQRKQ